VLASSVQRPASSVQRTNVEAVTVEQPDPRMLGATTRFACLLATEQLTRTISIAMGFVARKRTSWKLVGFRDHSCFCRTDGNRQRIRSRREAALSLHRNRSDDYGSRARTHAVGEGESSPGRFLFVLAPTLAFTPRAHRNPRVLASARDLGFRAKLKELPDGLRYANTEQCQPISGGRCRARCSLRS